MEKPLIDCHVHGKSPFSAICKHLNSEVGLRYHAIKYPADHPCDHQAWCLRCHRVLEKEGGWTARSKQFAGLQLVCTPCYRTALSHHREMPLR